MQTSIINSVSPQDRLTAALVVFCLAAAFSMLLNSYSVLQQTVVSTPMQRLEQTAANGKSAAFAMTSTEKAFRASQNRKEREERHPGPGTASIIRAEQQRRLAVAVQPVAEPQPGPEPAVSIFGGRYEQVQELEMEATAYTYTGNRTASGTWPEVGTVAVDPSVIQLGTRLYIEGYGYGVALDTGGAIKGKKLDVFLESKEEAALWGRKTVTVDILQPVE